MSTTERQLDEPVTLPVDDDFGRDAFAKYLSQFIVDAPRESSIRIGVLASWGEGKTSVMRLAAHHLRAAGSDVVIVPSWGGSSVAQIQSRILREVRVELKIPDTAPQKVRGLLGWITGEGRAAAEPLRAEIAEQMEYGNLALKAAGLIAAEMDAYFEREMVKIVKDRKGRRLVIMLDDMDRADPAVIPNLLMSVREAMALPNVTYVLALSPDVLRDALAKTGFGSVSADRFLEKIIEYPFRLRVPSEAEWEAALRRMIARTPDLPGAAALWAVREHLPRNPRRLKLFLRMLSANRSFLARFEMSELPWEIVHLTILLRLEFPDWTQALQNNHEIVSSLSVADAYWRAVRTYGETKEETPPAPEVVIPPVDHPERGRFLSLCEAIRAVGANWASTYDLKAILDVSSGSATMTRREAAAIVDELTRCNRQAWVDTIRARASSVAGSWESAAPRFWYWLLHERELALESLADASVPNEVEARLPRLDHLTDVAEVLLRELNLVSMTEVGPEVLTTLVEHCSRWAHFVREPGFAAIRMREREIIHAATRSVDPSTLIRIARGHRQSDGSLSNESEDFDAMLQDVQNTATLMVLEELRRAFTTAEGFVSLLRSEQDDARRSLLTDMDGPFFTPKNLQWLEQLAADATTSVPVRENLAMYLRALELALRGEIQLGQPRKVLELPGVVEWLWRGSTAQQLTYRAAGTMNFVRANLITNRLATEAQLPLPAWWQFGSAGVNRAGATPP